MRFGVWNVHAVHRSAENVEHIPQLVFDLTLQENLDVVVLVEVGELAESIGSRLAELGPYEAVLSGPRFGMFCRGIESGIDEIESPSPSSRARMFSVQPASQSPLLIALVHGRDSRNSSVGTQRLVLRHIVSGIEWAEDFVGHKRTIVIGDFNSNPFDEPMIAADGLHAIMSKREASRRFRTVDNEQFEFFYNPMFRLLDRDDDSPPATYFYNGSNTVEHFWHMLDQVVIRPELITQFDSESLRIVDRIGGTTLLDDFGRPDERAGSDHLPIVFSVDLSSQWTGDSDANAMA